MKISVITVVFNACDTIADTLRSVAAQSHPDIEHIVIDGGSTDGTVEIVERHRAAIEVFISEPDEGIYDAMNKGIAQASGEVIGLLNADDVFQDNSVLSQVASAHADPKLDSVYADLVYVDKFNLSKVRRYWRSHTYRPGLAFTGWMPAHPTLYLKRRVFERVGYFDTQLRFQADLEFCARAFEVHQINSLYVEKVWVRMRLGGATNNSLSNIWKGNWESYQALKRLGMQRAALPYFMRKFARKIPQFVNLGGASR